MRRLLRRVAGAAVFGFVAAVWALTAAQRFGGSDAWWLEFSRFLRSPLRVANQGEIAFSIGSATPFQMLGWSNPRVGVGYVFGDGLDVWHVNFGFPF